MCSARLAVCCRRECIRVFVSTRHTDSVAVIKKSTDMHLESGRAEDAQFGNNMCWGTNPVAGVCVQPQAHIRVQVLLQLRSRPRSGSSSANRSPFGPDPFRSGDMGSVGSVRTAWRGRFDAVRLVHFGHSSAVDPVRAISASSNPIDPGSVGRRSCSSPIGGQRPRSSPRPSQCPSPCLGPNQVQAQAQVYVRVQAQVYVQVEVRVQVHGQMSVDSISIMLGRKFEVQVPCIHIPSGCL